MKTALSISSILFLIIMISVLGAEIRDDEEIILYPSYGYDIGNGETLINIHGVIFEPENDSIVRKILFSALGGMLDLKEDSEESRIFNSRIKFFAVDNEGGKEIPIKLLDKIYTAEKSGSNGHFYLNVKTGAGIADKSTKGNTLSCAVSGKRNFPEGTIFLPGRKGISVISDIDDTIKISNVLDKDEMIKNVFLREFTPVQGMALLYRVWEKQGASFHYVSGSPWQLYVPLSDFLRKNDFPSGTMHLKHFRLKDSSAVKFIVGDQAGYKTGMISEIFKNLPDRKFILVGDSTESDPEIYGGLASKHKERVIAILIRDAGSAGNDPLRYKKIASDISPVPLRVFRDSRDIGEIYPAR